MRRHTIRGDAQFRGPPPFEAIGISFAEPIDEWFGEVTAAGVTVAREDFDHAPTAAEVTELLCKRINEKAWREAGRARRNGEIRKGEGMNEFEKKVIEEARALTKEWLSGGDYADSSPLAKAVQAMEAEEKRRSALSDHEKRIEAFRDLTKGWDMSLDDLVEVAAAADPEST